jgi:hypothetical protein
VFLGEQDDEDDDENQCTDADVHAIAPSFTWVRPTDAADVTFQRWPAARRTNAAHAGSLRLAEIDADLITLFLREQDDEDDDQQKGANADVHACAPCLAVGLTDTADLARQGLPAARRANAVPLRFRAAS